MRENTITPLNRHTLIAEFRALLQRSEYELPIHTQGIVILSGPYEKLADGQIKEDSYENIARITFGIEVLRKISAARGGEDFMKGPPLILNGETEQLDAMEKIALSLGYPREMIELVDCGKRGVGNTKTQFTVMEADPRFKGLKHLTFITSGYHVPRAERTAEKNLNMTTDYEVLPVPLRQFPFNMYMIRGEILKILQLARKDIAEFPHPDPSPAFQE